MDKYVQERHKYTKKTCKECGIRHPQPEMIPVETEVKTGTSRRGLMFRNVAGMILGSKSGKTAVKSWLFGNNKRQYTRNVTYWVCPNCWMDTLSNDQLEEFERVWLEEGIAECGSEEAFWEACLQSGVEEYGTREAALAAMERGARRHQRVSV
jgi:hypothetical protein